MGAENEDNTVTDSDLLGGLPLPVDETAATAAADATTTAATEAAAGDAAAAAETQADDTTAAATTEATETTEAAATENETAVATEAAATKETAATTKEAAAPPPTTAAKAEDNPAAKETAADPEAEFWAKHDALLARLESGTVDEVDLKAGDLAIIARGTAKARQRADAVAQQVQSERAAQQQASAYESGWATWQAANPDVKDGRNLWEQELAKARKEYGDGDVAVGAAKVLFSQRVAIIKGKAKPPAPPPPPATPPPAAPPASKARTSVAPLGGGARPAPAADPTPEELLVRETGGDGKGFLN